MSGSKRQRQLARAKYERQQARRAESEDRRRRNQRITAIVVVAVLVLGGLAYAVISVTSSNDATVAEAPPETAVEAVADAVGDPTEEADADSGAEPIEEPSVLDCGPAVEPRADTVSYDEPGDVEAASSITLTTTCGDIVIELDPDAPETVASETFLAESGFYDATQCHRLTTAGIYVLQCGDPAGNGTGGPGYTVPDENLPADGTANYPAGTVAMANAGPGTAGSQFFIVYEDTTLPGDYTIWGTVTSGLDIVQEVASVGTADGSGDGAPRQPMVIETATVQRS